MEEESYLGGYLVTIYRFPPTNTVAAVAYINLTWAETPISSQSPYGWHVAEAIPAESPS